MSELERYVAGRPFAYPETLASLTVAPPDLETIA
ncbi:hypothetical protein QFZ30_000373 [Arthrobacter pascens]|nr:hypothetical protein [Arthrobacter pascens]